MASSGLYRIRVSAVLNGRWSDWFDGLRVEQHGDDTVIFGRVPDQAALHGLLNKIRDLGLFLHSVIYLGPADGGESAGRPNSSGEASEGDRDAW